MELETTQPQIGDFPFGGEAAAALEAFRVWMERLQDMSVDNPLETLVVGVLGSAWVFYLAERGENEGVNTFDDALYYISTCLSVGYANIFPKTQMGKFVAAIVMMFGPALANWQVEGRLVARTAQAAAASGPELGPVIDKLDAILQVLKAKQTEAA